MSAFRKRSRNSLFSANASTSLWSSRVGVVSRVLLPICLAGLALDRQLGLLHSSHGRLSAIVQEDIFSSFAFASKDNQVRGTLVRQPTNVVDDPQSSPSTPLKRKKIFYHHISKAGGSNVIALANLNGEKAMGLRRNRKNFSCFYLQDCPPEVTFVQLEDSFEKLTPLERSMLFGNNSKDSEWITWTQVRSPASLEESWFREVKYGYRHDCLENRTFLDYIHPDFTDCGSRKRTPSLLQFLGGRDIFRSTPENVTSALPKSLETLDLFDVVTVLAEDRLAQDTMRRTFGWIATSQQLEGRSSERNHTTADLQADSSSSARWKAWNATLEPDYLVYETALRYARRQLVDGSQYSSVAN